jgi:hypothetical protein
MTGLVLALWGILAVATPLWMFLMSFYGNWQWPHCLGNRVEEE